MKKFTIEQEFWDIFPRAEIAVILARGIDNGENQRQKEIEEFLSGAGKDGEKWLTAPVLSQNKVIAVWREAYQKFKTKKKVRSSIENLLKRIEKGTGVGPINPLVDIYNAVSLIYGIPCGGEDIDTFEGDLRLTKAIGDECFMALGDVEASTALPEEIIYKDDVGAVCRSWNWRDGKRTMLTEDTVNAFLIIESVDPERGEDVRAAAKMLAEKTEEFLGGRTETFLMNVEQREIVLTD